MNAALRSTLVACLVPLAVGTAEAQDKLLTIEGSVSNVLFNGLSSSPFTGADIGDPVLLQVELSTASLGGSAEEQEYPLTGVSTYIEIGGAAVRFDAEARTVLVGNDRNFPQAAGVDYLVGSFMLNTFTQFEFTLEDASGQMFNTTSLADLDGVFVPAPQASMSFLDFPNPTTPLSGLFMEVAQFTLTDLVPVGTNYCGPARPNSTGVPGTISAFGSDEAALNRIELTASNLPPNVFTLFAVSRTQDFVPVVPNSSGALCLGGSIGRYVSLIASADVNGVATLRVDLSGIPQPTGFVAAVPGDTWNFQTWHREIGPVLPSNFTDAVSVTLL